MAEKIGIAFENGRISDFLGLVKFGENRSGGSRDSFTQKIILKINK